MVDPMTSHTKRRTYDHATYLEAMAAWDRGGFGPEWADWRNLAAKAGIIFPPSGSAEDSWADRSPSQRALVIRAIREMPRVLRRALEVPGVTSWGDVIGRLLTTRDQWAETADQRVEAWEAAKAPRHGAAHPVEDVLDTIAASLGVTR